MNNVNNDLSRLRSVMLKDALLLPDWIDIHKQSHKDVWDRIGDVIAVISKCNVNKVLADRTITKYNDEVSDLVIDIITYSEDEEIELQSSQYILNAINKYLERSIEWELYEVAENLTRFRNLYIIP